MDVYDWDFEAYVARQVGDLVRGLRLDLAQLAPSSPGPTLTEKLAAELERGYRVLEALPRTDAVWDGTNGLASQTKLRTLVHGRTDLAWTRAALAVGCRHLADQPCWDEATPVPWLVEASFLDLSAWDHAPPMLAVARRFGRETEFAALLQARAAEFPEWVRRELG